MMESTALQLETLFLVLSDRTRLRLLTLMIDGEVAVGFLVDELGESQPKISRHLAYLRSSGLVSTRRDGKWIYYAIERPENKLVAMVLSSALEAATGKIRLVEADLTDDSIEGGSRLLSEGYEKDELPIYLL